MLLHNSLFDLLPGANHHEVFLTLQLLIHSVTPAGFGCPSSDVCNNYLYSSLRGYQH